MKTKHTCYTYFFITGIFDTKEISKRLGLEPTDEWQMDKTDQNGNHYEESYWQIGLCENYDPYVFNMMRETIKPLLGKEKELKAIKEEFKVRMFLEVVCSMNPKEVLPAFGPTPDIVDFLHDSGVELDYDMYIDETEEETID